MALAPPAEKDGFSYAGDALYREASSLNRHRRATVPELKAHFNGTDDTNNNRPAHWYEAQLLHYGLAPSKVKGTAHKRLFDAVLKGGLSVPAHIQKIEAELKKEWMKREREAKKMAKESAAAPAKGTKRKADQVSAASTSVNVNLSVQVSSTGQIMVQTAQPASKKAKTAPKAAPKTPAPKPKATTPRAPKTAAKPPAKPKTTPKQTARSSFASGIGQAPRFATNSPASTDGPSFAANEAPPPYSEFDNGASGSSSNVRQQQKQYSSPPSSSQPKIGLLNGRYRVSCDHIEGNFPQYVGDLGLIATLDGKNLWLKFDFGIAEGIIKLPRPQEADGEYPAGAYWRGEALDRSMDRRLYNIDTVRRKGPLNHVYFLGGGHIRGKLSYGPPGDGVELDFDAYRLAGQSMTSEVSPAQARAEWARLDEYADS